MLPPDATAKQRDVRAKRSGLPIVFRCARLDIATGRGRLSRPPRSGMPWPVSGPTSPARLGPWSYLRRYDRGIGGGIAMLIATNVLFLGIPVTTGEVIVALERGDPEHQVVWLCLAMIGFALGTAVTRILSRVWIFNAARAAEYDLRGDLFRHLLTLDGPYHTTHPTGDTMSRLTNDVQTVRAMWGAGVLNIVNTRSRSHRAHDDDADRSHADVDRPACPTRRSSSLAGCSASASTRSSIGVQAQLGALSNEIQEDLTAIAAIKTYGLEADRRARFVASSHRLLDRNMDADPDPRRDGPGVRRPRLDRDAAGACTSAASRHIDGRLGLDQLVEMTQYLARLVWPTLALGWMLSLLQRGKASWHPAGQPAGDPVDDRRRHRRPAAGGGPRRRARRPAGSSSRT
jgi:ATP-binding cassette subfamily B multidrug efflux pump